MYNIADLNAMGDNELKSIAESMGLKKIDLSHKDELVYSILDQQAIDHAANAAERKPRQQKNKKENATQAQPEAQNAKAATRRGRPPKAKDADAPTDNEQQLPALPLQPIVEPAAEAPIQKAEEQPTDIPDTPKPRRGRPPKNRQAQEKVDESTPEASGDTQSVT
ncbi:MAG: Rho termination factor N-terminal domain-containing protein, partial [Muribaculaceae bacterium]|nr:Rho termination factor N-terminal domain-containing protein [Muribaculaceae bacterium]